jgi:hypothetical protein
MGRKLDGKPCSRGRHADGSHRTLQLLGSYRKKTRLTSRSEPEPPVLCFGGEWMEKTRHDHTQSSESSYPRQAATGRRNSKFHARLRHDAMMGGMDWAGGQLVRLI